MKRRTFFGVVAGAVAGLFVQPKKAEFANFKLEDSRCIGGNQKDHSYYGVNVDFEACAAENQRNAEQSCDVTYYYVDEKNVLVEYEPNGVYHKNTYSVIWGKPFSLA